MKHIKVVSPAAAAIPQPCKRTYYSIGEGYSQPFAAVNPNGSATETGVVICPHGKVEVYCTICDRDARAENSQTLTHDPATCPWCQKCFMDEGVYETSDGRRVFHEIDAAGKMTGLLVSYPASALDKTTGQFDVSRKIVWPS